MLYLSYNTYQKTNTVGGKIMQSKYYVTIASVSPKETSKVRGNFFQNYFSSPMKYRA
jgi:hypothetical protein